MKRFDWVKEQSCQLMFGQEDQSRLSITKETRMDNFLKLLDYKDIKMIFLTQRREKKIDMIALVVFAEMKKENNILGSYILQLITEADHYIGSDNEGRQKFRGIGIGRFLG